MFRLIRNILIIQKLNIFYKKLINLPKIVIISYKLNIYLFLILK
jgi:hypothetical protein